MEPMPETSKWKSIVSSPFSRIVNRLNDIHNWNGNKSIKYHMHCSLSLPQKKISYHSNLSCRPCPAINMNQIKHSIILACLRKVLEIKGHESDRVSIYVFTKFTVTIMIIQFLCSWAKTINCYPRLHVHELRTRLLKPLITARIPLFYKLDFPIIRPTRTTRTAIWTHFDNYTFLAGHLYIFGDAFTWSCVTCLLSPNTHTIKLKQTDISFFNFLPECYLGWVGWGRATKPKFQKAQETISESSL